MAKKKSLTILAVVVALYAGAHFIPGPAADNPPVGEVVPAPENVMTTLEGSCWDCHSNQTVWPWYSHVVPVKWFVREHVHDGRSHLNFTTWGQYSGEDKAHAMEEVVEVLEEGEMPLESYLRLHPEAELTEEERELLMEWARIMESRLRAMGGAGDPSN